MWERFLNWLGEFLSSVSAPAIPKEIPDLPPILKPVETPTPWMTWMKSHVGEPFATGKMPTKFNRMVFSYTDFGPLGNVMQPGCAAGVSAALVLTGHKRVARNAARALSWASYGMMSILKYGCIVVIEHTAGELKGHFHVAFFDHMGVNNSIVLLGANQDHLLCLKSFDLSKCKVVATRWPVLN